MTSKQGDGGSGSRSTRPTPLHRPFEDDIQRSLLRHQFPGFADVTGPSRSMCVDRLAEVCPGSLQDPLPPGPPPRVRQVAEERVFMPARSMTSAGAEMMADDDDDAVDSATGNITLNTTPGSGKQPFMLSSHFFALRYILARLIDSQHVRPTHTGMDSKLIGSWFYTVGYSAKTLDFV